MYCEVQKEHFTCNCTAIPLVFRTVLPTTKAFIISWDELFYSLLISVRVMCYQPARHNFPSSRSSLNVWPPNFASTLQADDNRSATNSPDYNYDCDYKCRFFSYEIIRHVSLYSDPLTCYFNLYRRLR